MTQKAYKKGLTFEWKCPKCEGFNFKLILRQQREIVDYHTLCRYCKVKYLVTYPKPEKEIEGEAEFLERLDREDFNREEKMDMIKDIAEIAALKADNALPGVIKEKQKALEAKIAFTKRQKRL